MSAATRLDALRRDLRQTLRSLAATPRLTLPALACIAAGIASTLLVAALADAVLYRAPALPEPERLARVWLQVGTEHVEQGGISYLEYRDLLAVRAFERVEAVARTRIAARTAQGSERLRGEAVTPGYFELIGTRPALGRLFTAAEQRAGGEPVLLIGHDLWQRHFAGRADVIGRRLAVRNPYQDAGETLYTVVGVMPPRFVGTVDPDTSEFWVPLEASPLRRMFAEREARNVWVLARIAEGATLAGAQEQLTAVGRRLAAEQPALYREATYSVEPFGETWRGDLRRGMQALLGAAALLLVIACVNVAHLLLARLSRRESELALRRALGASRRAILRQLALEVTLLALAGGALGTAVAWRATLLFADEAALSLPSYVPLAPDARLALLALGLVLATGLLFGLLPALLGAGAGPWQRLRGEARGATLGRRQGRLARVLVTSELAFTFVLVVAGALLLRSWQELTRTDVGFRTDHLLRMAISLDRGEHPDRAAVLAFAERARAALLAQPGVRDVSLMSAVLPPWFDDTFGVWRAGEVDPELREVARHAVDRDFLRVLDVALVAGRPFGPADRADGAPVALVSESLARRLTGGEAPAALGRPVRLVLDPESGELSPPAEIVGVVEDVRYHGPLGSERAPHDLYVPFEQAAEHTVSFAVHTAVEPGSLIAPLQRVLGALAPGSPQHWISTMEEELAAQLAGASFYGRLSALYSASAALLALLGVYGVMAHGVARRRAELAVRAAVGAGRRQLLRLVLGEALRVLVVGLGLGAGLALLATRALAGLLHGVPPHEPATFGAVAALLLALGLAASWLPARRAAAQDPAAVLGGS